MPNDVLGLPNIKIITYSKQYTSKSGMRSCSSSFLRKHHCCMRSTVHFRADVTVNKKKFQREKPVDILNRRQPGTIDIVMARNVIQVEDDCVFCFVCLCASRQMLCSSLRLVTVGGEHVSSSGISWFGLRAVSASIA